MANATNLLLGFSGILLGNVKDVEDRPYKIMDAYFDGQRARKRVSFNEYGFGQSRLPTSKSRFVVRPAPDLLYLTVWYDVSQYPLRLEGRIPDSYWSLSLFADNTDCFFVKNDTEYNVGDIVVIYILGPQHDPSKITEPNAIIAQSPSTLGFGINRVLVEDPRNDEMKYLQYYKDFYSAKLITTENLYKPLSRKEEKRTETLQSTTMYGSIAVLAGTLLLRNQRNATFLKNFITTALGSFIGYYISSNYFKKIAAPITDTFFNVRSTKSPSWWAMGSAGDPNADMYTRALIAEVGVFALTKDEAVYYFADADDDGNRMHYLNDYEVIWDKETVALPARWWSITAYAQDNFLIKNDLGKYSYTPDKDSSSNKFRFVFTSKSSEEAIASGLVTSEDEILPSGPAKDGRPYNSLSIRLYHPDKILHTRKGLQNIELPIIQIINNNVSTSKL